MTVNSLGYSSSEPNAFTEYVEVGQLYGLTAARYGRSVTATQLLKNPRRLISFLKMRTGNLGTLLKRNSFK